MCVDNIAISALVGLILPFTMPWPLEIFRIQLCVGYIWPPIVCHNEC